jgi:3-hydroxybutyrate dehydrogenase
MLKGKVAVVTGSTSGIGLGIARALAVGGADLVINGFGEAAAIEKLRQEIATTYGVRAAFSAADLSKPTDATGFIEDATRQLGRVDVLVNNAGIQHVAPVHEFPVERWDAVIAINLTAVFLTTRAVLPQMLARDWGRIINIASVHGLVASEDKSAYVASKA